MQQLDNISRLTVLRLDAEIRACHYRVSLKQQELRILTAQREEWKKQYKAELQRILNEQGLDLTKYTFDDETGVLSPIVTPTEE